MVQSFVNEDYPYAHFAKGRDFANGAFGVGILSRYEPQAVSSIPLESTGSRATKTLERVVIDKDGVQIALYNTHLSWENLDLRRRQIAQVIERVNADPIEYKIITADLIPISTLTNIRCFWIISILPTGITECGTIPTAKATIRRCRC